MRTTVRAWMALMAALTVLAVAAPTAGADATDCAPACVILVEVDGLESHDVSRTDTPFLWALAHPHAQSGDDVEGTIYDSLLAERNGFMWQAARAPMTASTAPAAASLLTGANPDQHGILADELIAPFGPTKQPKLQRLRSANDATGGTAERISTGETSTLLELAKASEAAPDPEVWAFVGNPALAVMLDGQLVQIDEAWSPQGAGQPPTSDPALCPLPRATPPVGDETGEEAEGAPQRDCPARDATTLQQAFQTFADAPETTPLLTYIHLAELGRIKQLHGDAEAARALEHVDTALAAFVEGLSNHVELSGAWGRTILVVTGNHGYEETLPDKRVPHPDHVGELEWDFSDFLTDAVAADKPTTLVPQGTIGTVYNDRATPAELQALAALIEQQGDAACEELAQEKCIDEVVPVARLAELHETWALNPLTAAGAPTGAGGQLVVTLEPGWAFGRVQERRPDVLEAPVAEATNPYPASSGGPRNRAIAMLMNGPSERAALDHTVRQGPAGGMPVKDRSEAPPDCGATSGVTLANANAAATMADDAAAPGHECQAETVDLALSIAALLELGTEGVPLAPQARFLNEAFTPALGPEVVVDTEEPPLPDPPPPPAPEPIVITRGSLQVITPPPPKDPFPYRGLIRRLRALVTDATGKPFALARRGSTLSTIQVQADFGKTESLVTLTFYRRQGAGRRARLSAIARFKPFSVKRGPVRLRLRIPARFRPTHLGVSVQQVETAADGSKQPVGRPGGGIAQITDARRLHARKGAARRRLR
jgi:Type I phosphodiesterase / nucleotide pyrophosphatase